MKKTVAVIFGGEGFESEISISSAKNIISSLDKKLYTPLPVFIDKGGNWKITEPANAESTESCAPEAYPVRLDGESGFLVLGRVIPVHLAIVAMHGNLGEDGVIQGALAAAKIKTLGQSVLACALTNDKASAKAVADTLGIRNARWVLLTDSDARCALKSVSEKLSYPIFLKASSFGSSYGAFRIETDGEFISAYEKIRSMGEERILAEEYIACDCELECAYIDFGEEYYLPFGIVDSHGRFYSLEEKYKSGSSFAPRLGKIPRETEKLAIEYSKALGRAMGIRYLARFDYFIVGCEPIFNEINCFPGMTETSLYPKIINGSLKSFSESLTRLIEYAVQYDRNI